jgi:hypothetical protein
MRRWKPKLSVGLWVGLLLLLLCLGGILALGAQMVWLLFQPPEAWLIDIELYGQLVALVALLLCTGFLLYRVAGALTLSYQMDRNGLYIVWIGNRAVIPLSQIESLSKGAPGAEVTLLHLRRIGYYWGRGRTEDGKLLHLFTTSPLRNSLVIHAEHEAYAISPAAQDSFVQELEQRRRLGAVKSLHPTFEPGRVFFYAFWNDRVVRWALICTFGLNLLLVGVLALHYPGLEPMVAMRFDATGQITELRPRHQVLFMPLAAFGLSLLNTGLGISFYRRNKTSARLLQLGSVFVQVMFGVALLAVLLA